MIRVKRFISTILFFLIGFILFLAVQKLFTPTWNNPQMAENFGLEIKSFYSLDPDSLEVVLLGTSHMECGISPMDLYEDYGIVSFNLGTSCQPVEVTRFFTSQIFKRQHPKVLALDVSTLFIDSTEESTYHDTALSCVLDNVPLSLDKIRLAYEYQKDKDASSDKRKTGEIHKDYFISSLIPIIKYHDRWEELSETDFRDYFRAEDYDYSGGMIKSKTGAM